MSCAPSHDAGVRLLTLVGSFAAVAALASSAAVALPDASSATKIKGTAKFPLTEASTSCAFAQEGDKVKERCVPGFGTFAGKPSRASSSLGWTWLLEVVGGAQTGNGTEQLVLKLNFGGGKTATLDCKGTLKPSDPQTPDAATIVGSGNCTVRSATGFARTLAAAAKGKCKTPAGKRKCVYKSKYKRTGSHYDGPEVFVNIDD